jgi:hypothetical protein
MHCPHIRQSQIVSFVTFSTTRIALRIPVTGEVVLGGLRSSLLFLILRAPPARTDLFGGPVRELPSLPAGYDTGICLLGSTKGISTTTPFRVPHSVSTPSDVPRLAYSTGTHANPMFLSSRGE